MLPKCDIPFTFHTFTLQVTCLWLILCYQHITFHSPIIKYSKSNMAVCFFCFQNVMFHLPFIHYSTSYMSVTYPMQPTYYLSFTYHLSTVQVTWLSAPFTCLWLILCNQHITFHSPIIKYSKRNMAVYSFCFKNVIFHKLQYKLYMSVSYPMQPT